MSKWYLCQETVEGCREQHSTWVWRRRQQKSHRKSLSPGRCFSIEKQWKANIEFSFAADVQTTLFCSCNQKMPGVLGKNGCFVMFHPKEGAANSLFRTGSIWVCTKAPHPGVESVAINSPSMGNVFCCAAEIQCNWPVSCLSFPQTRRAICSLAQKRFAPSDKKHNVAIISF